MSSDAQSGGSSSTSPQSDVEQNSDEPVVEIEFEGPATFTRAINREQNIVGVHNDVQVQGTLEVTSESLFEIAKPGSDLGSAFIARKIGSSGELTDGYSVEDSDEWEISILGSVDSWTEIAMQVQEQLSYPHGSTKSKAGINYLLKLASNDILDQSGLLAILEIEDSEDYDATIPDRKREEIVQAISKL
jgi:hypothetical protein